MESGDPFLSDAMCYSIIQDKNILGVLDPTLGAHTRQRQPLAKMLPKLILKFRLCTTNSAHKTALTSQVYERESVPRLPPYFKKKSKNTIKCHVYTYKYTKFGENGAYINKK